MRLGRRRKPIRTKRYSSYEKAKRQLSIYDGIKAVKSLVRVMKANLENGTWRAGNPFFESDRGDRLEFTPDEFMNFAIQACDEFMSLLKEIEGKSGGEIGGITLPPPR